MRLKNLLGCLRGLVEPGYRPSYAGRNPYLEPPWVSGAGSFPFKPQDGQLDALAALQKEARSESACGSSRSQRSLVERPRGDERSRSLASSDMPLYESIQRKLRASQQRELEGGYRSLSPSRGW